MDTWDPSLSTGVNFTYFVLTGVIGISFTVLPSELPVRICTEQNKIEQLEAKILKMDIVDPVRVGMFKNNEPMLIGSTCTALNKQGMIVKGKQFYNLVPFQTAYVSYIELS